MVTSRRKKEGKDGKEEKHSFGGGKIPFLHLGAGQHGC